MTNMPGHSSRDLVAELVKQAAAEWTDTDGAYIARHRRNERLHSITWLEFWCRQLIIRELRDRTCHLINRRERGRWPNREID